MKLKYSPQKADHDTQFHVVDQNTLEVGGRQGAPARRR
jgi:hypothetical protein